MHIRATQYIYWNIIYYYLDIETNILSLDILYSWLFPFIIAQCLAIGSAKFYSHATGPSTGTRDVTRVRCSLDQWARSADTGRECVANRRQIQAF